MGNPIADACTPREDYMQWFLKKTQVLIGNSERQDHQPLGGSAALLASAMQEIVSFASSRTPHASEEDQDAFAFISDKGNAVLTKIGYSAPTRLSQITGVAPDEVDARATPDEVEGLVGLEVEETISIDSPILATQVDDPKQDDDCIAQRDLSPLGAVSLRKRQHEVQIPILWPFDGVLTHDWVMELKNVFEWGSRAIQPSEFPSMLPWEVFDRLVLSAAEILHKECNCVKIDGLGEVSKVIVVGDIHGQLHDLLRLFEKAGYPSKNQVFVFNGDYVDHGAWGLETILLLLAWKVLLPNEVFLLRGNHESEYCASMYGFAEEVSIKYGVRGNDAFHKCLSCFQELPLASIIAGRVFMCHGGLFRSKSYKGKKKCRNSFSLGSLEELAKVKRFVLDPSRKGQNLILGDILWSDPSMEPGLFKNKKGV